MSLEQRKRSSGQILFILTCCVRCLSAAAALSGIRGKIEMFQFSPGTMERAGLPSSAAMSIPPFVIIASNDINQAALQVRLGWHQGLVLSCTKQVPVGPMLQQMCFCHLRCFEVLTGIMHVLVMYMLVLESLLPLAPVQLPSCIKSSVCYSC